MFELQLYGTAPDFLGAVPAKSRMLGLIAPLIASIQYYIGDSGTADYEARVANRIAENLIADDTEDDAVTRWKPKFWSCETGLMP